MNDYVSKKKFYGIYFLEHYTCSIQGRCMGKVWGARAPYTTLCRVPFHGVLDISIFNSIVH